MNSDIEKKVQDAIKRDEILENAVSEEIDIAIGRMMFQHAYGEKAYFKVCDEAEVFGWILQDYLNYKTHRTKLYSFYDFVSVTMNDYIQEHRKELINAFTEQLNERIDLQEEIRKENPEEYDDTEPKYIKERLIEIINILQSPEEHIKFD